MNLRARPPEALLARYAELIDAGDFDGVGRLFAHAVITDPSGSVVAQGASEVAALYRSTTRRFADGTPRTKHLTTNQIVALDDDGATALVRSYFVVLQQVDDGPLQPIVAGRYRDRLDHVNGTWRFASRQMLPALLGDVSKHLLFDVSRLADGRTNSGEQGLR